MKTAQERLDIITEEFCLTYPEWCVFCCANYYPTNGVPEIHLLETAVGTSAGDPVGVLADIDQITMEHAQNALKSMYEFKYLKCKNNIVKPTHNGREMFLHLRNEMFPELAKKKRNK